MATKKQKHARALAAREEYLRREREVGLEAQRRDREQREKEAEQFRAFGKKYELRLKEAFRQAGLTED